MYGFIINQTSGNGKGHRVWKSVEEMLKQRNQPFIARYTEGPKHATTLVSEFSRKNVKTIVVLGGDGTINEVVNGMADQDLSLGVIPTGSGNDFARCLGVPKNEQEALERIFKQQTKPFDLLHLGHRYGLTVTGIGFDGEVAKNVDQSLYKKYLNWFRLGGLSYAVSVLKTLRTYQPTNVHITLDGEDMTFSNVWLVAVANAPNYGGGITICPDASYNDGCLNLCIVHGMKKGELLRLLPKAYKGKHTTEKNVTLLQGEDVYIHSDPPVLVQSDGEQVMKSPVHIRIKKNALRVL